MTLQIVYDQLSIAEEKAAYTVSLGEYFGVLIYRQLQYQDERIWWMNNVIWGSKSIYALIEILKIKGFVK